MKRFIVTIVLGTCHGEGIHAGKVRTVSMNDESMERVNLSLGKSTVLRFPDSPRKTILGNQNYYKIEFTDKDVTIQPRGKVPTNLFVYAGKRIYGFLLTAGESGDYDDFVKVFWKKSGEKAPMGNPRPDTFLGKDLRVSLVKVFRIKPKVEIVVVDFMLENRMSASIDTNEVRFQAVDGENRSLHGEIIFERDEIAGSRKARVRVFVRDMKKKGFSVHMEFGNYKVKVAEVGPS